MARHGQPLSVHLFLAFWLAAKVASLSLSLCLFVCLTLSLSFFRQGYGAGDFCLSLSLSFFALLRGREAGRPNPPMVSRHGRSVAAEMQISRLQLSWWSI